MDSDEQWKFAKECGAIIQGPSFVGMPPSYITFTPETLAFYIRAIKTETLVTAAETFKVIGYSKFKQPHEELLDMADKLSQQ